VKLFVDTRRINFRCDILESRPFAISVGCHRIVGGQGNHLFLTQHKRTHRISLFLPTFSVQVTYCSFHGVEKEELVTITLHIRMIDLSFLSLAEYSLRIRTLPRAIETLASPCVLVSPFMWYRRLYSYYASQFFSLVSREERAREGPRENVPIVAQSDRWALDMRTALVGAHKNFSRVENNQRRCTQAEQAGGGKVESMIFAFHWDREKKRNREREKTCGMCYHYWSLFQPFSAIESSYEQTAIINFVLSVCQWDNTNPNEMICHFDLCYFISP